MKTKYLLRKALNERVSVTVSKAEVEEVIAALNNGVSYSNNYYQFVKRKDGAMLRYDIKMNKYKFYTDIHKFAREIVRFWKRGS